MARPTLLCLLLLATSLHHVTSFAVHRRHSRSTDLAEALRMLERQRRRIDNEENLLASSPQLLGDRRLTMEDLEPWFGAGQGSRSDDEVGAAWLAKTLGLDGYNGMAEGLAEEDAQPGVFLQEPAEAPPLEVAPSDQELNAIFGEKNDDDDDNDEATASFRTEKKDKEIMTDAKGDARPMVETRSSDNNVIVAQASESDEDDVRLTKDEFKALLKAVEKLQKQAIDKAEEDVEEAEKVAVGVQEKVAEAREEAKEAEEEEEEEEERQEEEEEGVLTPKPQPVSKEELDNLFEEDSEEVKVMFVHC